MGKLAMTLILLCSMVMVVPAVHGIAKGPKAVEEWFQKLIHKKEKLTKLRFYFHDTLSGKTPTAVRVAQANTTSISPTLFGVIYMMDDPLTAGPEPNYRMEDLGLLMTMNLVFTAGKFNGSSLSVLGRNPALEQYREMPVVGGSGVFRLSRGIATAKTHWFDYTTGDAIVEYQVLAIHY